MSVDWGAAVGNRRDVRIGGWLGIILAGSFSVTMALLTVAGAVGQMPRGVDLGNALPTLPLSFHWAVFTGIGGIKASVILCLFGVATLAPACYSAWSIRERISEHWPVLRRSVWTRIAGVLAFVLVATTLAERIEEIFHLLGAVFAPAAGALVADAVRQKGQWLGMRRGWNPAGLSAWVLGMAVGLVPVIGNRIDWSAAERFQPAALFAFLTSAVLYWIFAAVGLEVPRVGVPESVLQEPGQSSETAL